MLNRRGIIIVVVVGFGALVVAFVGWQAWQVRSDLDRAEASVEHIKAAIESGDTTSRDAAIAELEEASGSAAGRTDGPMWGALTWLPFLGDDAEGVRVVSQTLDQVARGGIRPLSETMSSLDEISVDGKVDLEAVTEIQVPVANAADVFTDAARSVSALDSSSFVGEFGRLFDDYEEQVSEAASALRAADRASHVLPDMLGGNGARDYLLIFQNNAELRATGGLPGSWARVHAVDGALEMREQGSLLDFPVTDEPVLPLTGGEVDVYGKEMGLYFADPGFTPDFPRAAELWNAHWASRHPATELDGVIALDPVSISYILEGTGPVQVADRTLTADNVLYELLSRPYLELAPKAQDAFFEDVAPRILEVVTGEVGSPVELVQALSRAARERRFLVAPFVADDATALAESTVLGAMSGDDGSVPHVDVGLNDATGSKMSYYLRYGADVVAKTCDGSRQVLSGTMTLRQSIAPSVAAELPAPVTGGGSYGTDAGSQLVQVRLYGPYGGTIDRIVLDGSQLEPGELALINGRPVVTISVLLETRDDVVLTWDMRTGDDQTADGRLQVTPGALPGSGDGTFESECQSS